LRALTDMAASLSTVLLLVSCLPTMAATKGTRYTATFPPPDYDVSYKGVLTIERTQTEDEVRKACPSVANEKRALACALVYGADVNRNMPGYKCHIYMVNDSILKEFGAAGAVFAFILRHELAHCNGWPADHPKGTKIDMTSRNKMPTLPESTQWVVPTVSTVPTDKLISEIMKENAELKRLGEGKTAKGR
jgi:hypothetical protein